MPKNVFQILIITIVLFVSGCISPGKEPANTGKYIKSQPLSAVCGIETEFLSLDTINITTVMSYANQCKQKVNAANCKEDVTCFVINDNCTIKYLANLGKVQADSCIPLSAEVRSGDLVSVNYNMSFLNGTVLDSTYEDVAKEFELNPAISYEPVVFNTKTGILLNRRGQVLSGIREAVIGMKAGEEKSLILPPEKAFGNRKDELIRDIPIEDIKAKIAEPNVGSILIASNGMPVEVVAINDTHATVDFNYKYAGYTIMVDLKIEKVYRGSAPGPIQTQGCQGLEDITNYF